MTSQEFIIWLKGFVSAAHEYAPTPKQWQTLKDELSKVSDYEDLEQLENDFFGEYDWMNNGQELEENNERMDIIGQNGNEGTHYDDEFDDYGKRVPPCVGHEIANQEEQNK